MNSKVLEELPASYGVRVLTPLYKIVLSMRENFIDRGVASYILVRITVVECTYSSI